METVTEKRLECVENHNRSLHGRMWHMKEDILLRNVHIFLSVALHRIWCMFVKIRSIVH